MMENSRNSLEAAQNQPELPEQSPALNRIFNRVSARVAVMLSALSAASCGGNVEVHETYLPETDAGTTAPDAQAPDAESACNPIPNCPAVPVSIYDPQQPDKNYYFETDRWFRVDPNTNEIYKVCEPVYQQECAPGQQPQNDNCSIPTCKNATTCDPIIAAKSLTQPMRFPYVANLPTSTEYIADISYYQSHPEKFPVIFDTTPDCAVNEKPTTESYYTCDVIPTCAKTIPYCDPLPRCKPGQSPISCEDSPNMGGYSFKDDCQQEYNKVINLLAWQGVNPDPLTLNADLCEEKYNSALNETFYAMPKITINCRHIPECAEGETPVRVTATVNLECGKWYSGSYTSDYQASCDPIKSCQK